MVVVCVKAICVESAQQLYLMAGSAAFTVWTCDPCKVAQLKLLLFHDVSVARSWLRICSAL